VCRRYYRRLSARSVGGSDCPKSGKSNRGRFSAKYSIDIFLQNCVSDDWASKVEGGTRRVAPITQVGPFALGGLGTPKLMSKIAPTQRPLVSSPRFISLVDMAQLLPPNENEMVTFVLQADHLESKYKQIITCIKSGHSRKV
jgi:hypothetical protein